MCIEQFVEAQSPTYPQQQQQQQQNLQKKK